MTYNEKVTDIIKKGVWGAWVAPSVKHLDFGSGHDLGVMGSSPASASVLLAWNHLGFSLSLTPACSLSLPQSK